MSWNGSRSSVPNLTWKKSNPGFLLDRFSESTIIVALMMEERREFERYQIPIPCTLYWHGHIIKGQISNLSLGGALITRLSAIPPEHAFVVLTFQAEEGQVQLRGELTSRVVHTLTESQEPGESGSIGVQFQDPIEKVSSQLIPVFRALDEEDH